MHLLAARDTTRSRAAESVVRVVSIPAGHPYVARVCAADGVALLADPPVPGAPAAQWWPPQALDPEWIADHADDADVLHVHFGTESFPPGHVAACIRAAHTAGWVVVATVHDLEHPQLPAGTHPAADDELLAGADAVITLTPGAAAAVRLRTPRHVEVIPHPSLLAPGDLTTSVTAEGSAEVRLGVHLKDLRPSVDGPGTVRALGGAVRTLRAAGIDAVGEVRLHHRVRDEAARAEVRAVCAVDPGLELIEHERLDDAGLARELGRLDACVLPYRYGTHSGWLELCWDLAVPVAAPRRGFFLEQHPDDGVAGFDPGDTASLVSALRALLADPASTRTGTAARAELRAERARERRRTDTVIADAHLALYRRLLDGRAA
jgi:hypothetical protein